MIRGQSQPERVIQLAKGMAWRSGMGEMYSHMPARLVTKRKCSRHAALRGRVFGIAAFLGLSSARRHAWRPSSTTAAGYDRLRQKELRDLAGERS